MAKVEKSEVVVGAGGSMSLDNASWATVRGHTNASFQYGLDGDARGTALASSFATVIGIQYNPGRSTSRTVRRVFWAFDTSGIKDMPAEVSLSVALLELESTTNSDFKIQIIKGDPTEGKNGASEASWDSSTEPTTDAFDHFVGSIFYSAGGGDPGVAWEVTAYSEEIEAASLSYSGNSSGGSGTINLLKLNDQARQDIAQYDEFRICIMDVKHDKNNVDPDVTYTATGDTLVTDFIYMEGLVHAGNAANRPMLKILQGKVKAGKSDKKPVNDTFTVQGYEAATEQRDVFVNKNTASTVDQVPFLLGHKGPLSLRGRELQNNGSEKSSTPAPHSIASGD